MKNNKTITIRIDIDEDMKFSLNKIWAWGPGSQWVRKAKRDLWHEEVESVIEKIKIKKINYPVTMEYIFFFRTRYLDCSNNALHIKLIEDALVAEKIIEDDTNEYIRKFSVEVPIIDKKERSKLETDYVIINIIPYE